MVSKEISSDVIEIIPRKGLACYLLLVNSASSDLLLSEEGKDSSDLRRLS